MSPSDKPLVWLQSEVKTPPFSSQARLDAGFYLLQKGESLGMPISRASWTVGPLYVLSYLASVVVAPLIDAVSCATPGDTTQPVLHITAAIAPKKTRPRPAENTFTILFDGLLVSTPGSRRASWGARASRRST